MAVAPVFVTEDVSVYYDSFQTVANVSLAIYENEITAFIGSSGSGKSTMLRALNRMNDFVPPYRIIHHPFAVECGDERP